jgi:hypothetical protein
MGFLGLGFFAYRKSKKERVALLAGRSKQVDLISERQPQGRVFVCVQDQDKHTGQHVGVSPNFVAVHETQQFDFNRE